MSKESLSVLIIEENKGYAETTSLYVKEALPFAKVAVVGSFCNFLNYLENNFHFINLIIYYSSIDPANRNPRLSFTKLKSPNLK